MPVAYIGLGSNINAENNIYISLQQLSKVVGLQKISTMYYNNALGKNKYPEFLNGVVEIKCANKPMELKSEILKKIENNLNRVRTDDPFAPRTIDLDILLYDDLIINEPHLQIPDKDIIKREFIAHPLSEIAPHLQLPGDSINIKDIVKEMSAENLRPALEFTQKLKKEFINER